MVAMCGHATLASAVVLFGQHPTVEKIAFGISNGTVLNATRLPAGVVSLTLPADESVLAPLAGDDAAREGAVAAALAAAPTLLGHVIAAEKSQRGFIVEVDETVDLKGLVVDPAPFVSRARCPRPVVAAELTPTRLWVSPPPHCFQAPISAFFALAQASPADPDFDIKSRVFAPAVGLPEDPVVSGPLRLARPDLATWPC